MTRKVLKMEITNEERREVAERIRERICRNHRAVWDVVLELSCIDVFGDRFRMNKEFTLFLADLIDRPTCELVEVWDDERMKHYLDCTACRFGRLAIELDDEGKLFNSRALWASVEK